MILLGKLTILTMGKLCRRLGLLAGLVLLCVCLPLLAGRGAEASLSEGISFSGISLALTGPEGDGTAETLAQYLGNMADVSRYCRVEAMSRREAESALAEGRVTAALILPEDLIGRIWRGEDTDLELLVDGDRPLESALTLWVGQSAADLLASVQSGISAVLARYDAAPPPGLDRDRVVGEINLRYVQWTLNRQDLFRTETLLPTGSLPVSLHYGLSLFCFLLLSMAPLWAWCFQGAWPRGLGRLLYVGRSPLFGFCAAAAACALPIVPVSAAGLAAVGGAVSIGDAVLYALFFAAHASFWASLTHSEAGCGAASGLAGAALLFLAGGIVPPVLLPPALARLGSWTPIAWMRALASPSLGHPGRPALCLAGLSLVLLTAAGALYCRRVRREGASG